MITDNLIGSIARTSVLALAILAVGCSSYGKKKNSGGGDDPSAETEETASDGDEVPPGETTVNGDTLDSLESAKAKVRNYSQFYSTYASLLEVPENDQNLSDFFTPIKTNLPTLTDAKGFLGSHQLALVKLGSKVCERSWDLNNSAESRSKIFGVDTSATTPADAFDSENSHILARTLISRLWGQDFDALNDDDSYVKIIVQLISDSVTEISAFNAATSNANKIKYGAVGACTAVLTSAGVSFYGQ